MKIKIFERLRILTGEKTPHGFDDYRIETNVELEKRINDFMIDKNVVSVQSQELNVLVIYTD